MRCSSWTILDSQRSLVLSLSSTFNALPFSLPAHPSLPLESESSPSASQVPRTTASRVASPGLGTPVRCDSSNTASVAGPGTPLLHSRCLSLWRQPGLFPTPGRGHQRKQYLAAVVKMHVSRTQICLLSSRTICGIYMKLKRL